MSPCPCVQVSSHLCVCIVYNNFRNTLTSCMRIRSVSTLLYKFLCGRKSVPIHDDCRMRAAVSVGGTSSSQSGTSAAPPQQLRPS